MKRPLLISALFAILGGGATFLALNNGTGGPEVQTERIVVAARDVEPGRTLTVQDVALTDMPLGTAGADALRDADVARGKYAARPLIKGETVLRSKLSDDPPGSQLAVVIPEGRVAVSVAVSDVVSTGGLIAPGDRVDVLGVLSEEAQDSAEIVLRDVPVLAVAGDLVGASAQPEPDKKKSSGRDNPTSLKSTVTLAVTLEEARRLVQVDELATLRLAVRHRADLSNVVQASR